MTSEPIERLVNAEGLPTHYSQIVRHFWVPLANDIARRAQQEKPLIVGINGAQGSGKTTLCQFMEILLAERGLRAVTLALDDLYLTRSERDRLATEVHPLFATRGVPGTHAPGLGMAIIDAVRKGVSFDMPRFDKIRDDREPERRRIDGPVDVLLFEGWCVDAHPQADEELLEPANPLESEEDPEGIWRSVANLWLRGEYRTLFDRLDMLVMLKVDDFAAVLANRRRQEERLYATPGADRTRMMDDAALLRFCRHYERLTLHMLEDLPRRADHLFAIDRAQAPVALPASLKA